MKYEILSRPVYASLQVELTPGDTVVAESGSMAWMDPTIQATTTTRGGILKGLKRKLLAGESFFQNTYSLRNGASSGRIRLTPGCAGDIVALPLQDGELVLEKGAYLASLPGVTCDAKWDGFRGFFNEGMFLLRCTGTGLLFFTSYGAIQCIDVDGEYVVDNGFAVAWDPSLTYRLSRARRVRSFLFGDQLILRFQGRGRVWVQSRSPHALANWVYPWRPDPPRSNND
ncbi:MAG: TIGR00266 family protein [Planctomycetes bacterium]|nr:TIGR00266 family protein [Planctomycetota bacterium]